MDKVIEIREAVREDCQEIQRLIKELANFEGMPEGPKIDHKFLEEDGFNPYPLFKCYVAICDSKLVGYALYFYTYSSYEKKAVHLEDLYVTPDYRQKNVGSRLFYAVAKKIVDEKCQYLDFSVLSWNPAQSFYKSKGSLNLTEMEGWHMFRFHEDILKHFATNYIREGFEVREATIDDMPSIKKLNEEAVASQDTRSNFDEVSVAVQGNRDYVSRNPYFGYIVILQNDKILGYVSFSYAYSTWEGKSLYLQKLYVSPHELKFQIETDLLTAIGQKAFRERCCRIDFWLLDPKDEGMFYIMNGAIDMTESEEWHLYRLYEIAKKPVE